MVTRSTKKATTTDDDIFPPDEAQAELVGNSGDSWDGSVSATFKAGPSYSDPWLIFRSPTANGLALAMEDSEAVGRVISAMAEIEEGIKTLAVKAPERAAGASKGTSGSGTPNNATSAPGGASRTCEHGEMIYKTGITKTGKNAGKQWKAFMCPSADREDQCEPQWV